MCKSNQLVQKALRNLDRPDLLETRAYVDGVWIDGEQRAPVFDPATQETIAHVAHCASQWVDAAIDAAARAFGAWRDQQPAARGAILRRWASLLRANTTDLAVLIVVEQGKPLREAAGEIAYAASFLDWFAAEGERAYGETLPSHKPYSRLSVSMQPVGVVAAITPWNFPCAMIARKAAAALAAGCCVIVKPAPETPLSALALARLAREAGLPGGVFQVVTGDAQALTARLLASCEVRALSFTGSTEVGRLLLEQSAATIKKVSMELGGHAPFIVFNDAPFDNVVRAAIEAKFTTSGQDCLAANRIYVHKKHYEAFVEAFGIRASRLKIGHGLQEGIDIGPMTKGSAAEKCRRHVEDAIAKGARVVTGTEPLSLGPNFVRPTVLAGAADHMLIATEETFGPIAAIFSFDDEDEVLQRSNNSEMGLAAYVYTRDLNRALRLTDRLEYGMVGVNTTSFTGASVPFGGWKQSGLGREGSHRGLSEFMEPKYVCYGAIAE